MANIVDRQLLVDGSRKVVLAVYFRSDGATGDLDKEVLLSRKDTELPIVTSKGFRFSIEQITYNFAGFDAVLEFAGGIVTPSRKWVLTEGTNASVDFTPYGGLNDDFDIVGRTGDLTITTTGFNSVQDQGSMIIMLKKKPF
jgi:hypothetical protein